MGVPDKVKVIESFDANQYLGTWYEIARLDHSFERGLDNVPPPIACVMMVELK